MASTRVAAGLVIIGVLTAAPLWADQGQRRRSESDRRDTRSEERTARNSERGGERAVPRAEVQREEVRRQEIQRQDVRRQQEIQRQDDSRRDSDVRRDYGRPSYSNRSYGRTVVVRPRVIRPTIVTVVPYRPYVYRPSYSVGVHYGSGGYYPYGYTPRGYYDPIPGRIYGGLRISGAPHSAHVFADGYYVGIVNDFDGVFQHLNLEAGPHRIRIEEPGFEPIEFDVFVQPGRTITFRADMYRY